MTITLPWPPSMNRYWRSVAQLRGRVLVSEEGRRYRRIVKTHVLAARLTAFSDLDRLDVTVLAYPPDRRARDLDNLLKPLVDSIMAAGVMPDDSQIDRIEITRKPIAKPGRVEVTIETIDRP
jgi:crossover junction endodeoxyribonuclease RusA